MLPTSHLLTHQISHSRLSSTYKLAATIFNNSSLVFLDIHSLRCCFSTTSMQVVSSNFWKET
jgi:hypothetical protein